MLQSLLERLTRNRLAGESEIETYIRAHGGTIVDGRGPNATWPQVRRSRHLRARVDRPKMFNRQPTWLQLSLAPTTVV